MNDRFHQGAKVRVVSLPAPRPSWVRNVFTEGTRPMKSEARALAEANRQKTWARRWLRANGSWV